MNQMPEMQTNFASERQVNLNPVQWNQALGMARKLCADVFRQGGGPQDAVRTFGKAMSGQSVSHWGQAINLIAFMICVPSSRNLVH